MPCERQWTDRGVVSRCWADVVPWEFLQSIEAITADERFDDLRYIIVDCLDVRSLSIDVGTQDAIAALCVGVQCTNPNIRVLIVSGNPEFDALLRSMVAMSQEESGLVRVFGNVQEARSWLERQPVRNGLLLRAGN